MRSITMFAGPYDIPHGEVDVDVVLTNKLPTGLNRGYGGQQQSSHWSGSWTPSPSRSTSTRPRCAAVT